MPLAKGHLGLKRAHWHLAGNLIPQQVSATGQVACVAGTVEWECVQNAFPVIGS